MSLFNKLKKGVADAGNVAKSTVESNRLKAQISKHQTDIQSLYLEIGKKVFSTSSSEQPVNVELVAEEINLIQENLTSIKQLEINIKAIWNEKECLCGKLVSLDAKFCSTCGHKFTPNPISTPVGYTEAEGTEQQETMVLLPKAEPVKEKEQPEQTNTSTDSPVSIHGICANCDAQIEDGAKFCGECGNSIE